VEAKIQNAFLFSFLTLVFTVSLTFTSLEFPKLADELISKNWRFVNVHTGSGELQELKTELYIRHFHIRTIGYISLFIIITLIILGFVTEKLGFTTLGAFAIFLPVFSHFAATMFFLGGLGFLRLLWLPGLDISFDIMRLGDAVFIPYRIILDVFNFIGINLYSILAHIFIISGIIIFCAGTIVWLYTYYNRIRIARTWIYRISRHPQYLGWIIWSYGILLLPGANMKQSYSISDSLAWLISTMVIIGVAMLEELKMNRKYSKEYEKYREKSYFMFPLPKYICKVISAPFKVFFNKKIPTRKIEIITINLFYFFLIILISFVLNSTTIMKARGKWVLEFEDKRNIEELSKFFTDTPNRRDKYSAMQLMVEKGDSSIPFFIELVNNNDPVIREFSVDALGLLGTDKAIRPLIESLKDQNGKVVRSALRSIGNYKSDKAVDALINLLESENENLVSLAAGALVRIGSEKSVEAVIPLAKEGIITPDSDLMLALSKLTTEDAEELIIKYMNDKNPKIRQVAVIAARNFDSQKIRKSLEIAFNDDDWEVRLFAEEVLEEL
jgi:protein-S-isoprenylcysteine O-methyltransferase Ste14